MSSAGPEEGPPPPPACDTAQVEGPDRGAAEQSALPGGSEQDARRRAPCPRFARDAALDARATGSRLRSFTSRFGCTSGSRSASATSKTCSVAIAVNDQLNTVGVAERRLWAARVLDKLVPEIRDERRVVMLAGARYREFLIEPLGRLGMKVVVPMAHLTRGEQLGWLTELE